MSNNDNMDEEHDDVDEYGTLEGCTPSFRKLSGQIQAALASHLEKYQSSPEVMHAVLMDFQNFMMVETCTCFLLCLSYYGNEPELASEEAKKFMCIRAMQDMNQLTLDTIEKFTEGRYSNE